MATTTTKFLKMINEIYTLIVVVVVVVVVIGLYCGQSIVDLFFSRCWWMEWWMDKKKIFFLPFVWPQKIRIYLNKKQNRFIKDKPKYWSQKIVIPGMHSTIEISITMKSLTTNELIIDNHIMSVQKKKQNSQFFSSEEFCSTVFHYTHTQYKSNVNYP